MSVDAKKFKGLIEEIEASEKRSKSEAEHRAAIFKRAKGDGLNPKLMRVIVRERRRNESERQKEQDELDTYRAALNAAVALVHNEGLSQREAARRSGVSKSSLNRALAVPAVSHDPETGEITETADRKPPGDSSERDGEGSSSGEAVATFAAPETCVDGESVHLQAADSIVPRRTNPQTEGASTPSVTPVPEEGEGTGTIEPGRARVAAESERPAPAPIAEPIDWDAINATRPRELDRRKVAA